MIELKRIDQDCYSEFEKLQDKFNEVYEELSDYVDISNDPIINAWWDLCDNDNCTSYNLITWIEKLNKLLEVYQDRQIELDNQEFIKSPQDYEPYGDTWVVV